MRSDTYFVIDPSEPRSPRGLGDAVEDIFKRAGAQRIVVESITIRGDQPIIVEYQGPHPAGTSPYAQVHAIAEIQSREIPEGETGIRTLLTGMQLLKTLNASFRWILAPSEEAINTRVFPSKQYTIDDLGIPVCVDATVPGIFVVGSRTGSTPMHAQWALRLWEPHA